jgi:hypothetical protein
MGIARWPDEFAIVRLPRKRLACAGAAVIASARITAANPAARFIPGLYPGSVERRIGGDRRSSLFVAARDGAQRLPTYAPPSRAVGSGPRSFEAAYASAWLCVYALTAESGKWISAPVSVVQTTGLVPPQVTS